MFQIFTMNTNIVQRELYYYYVVDILFFLVNI